MLISATPASIMHPRKIDPEVFMTPGHQMGLLIQCDSPLCCSNWTLQPIFFNTIVLAKEWVVCTFLFPFQYLPKLWLKCFYLHQLGNSHETSLFLYMSVANCYTTTMCLQKSTIIMRTKVNIFGKVSYFKLYLSHLNFVFSVFITFFGLTSRVI